MLLLALVVGMHVVAADAPDALPVEWSNDDGSMLLAAARTQPLELEPVTLQGELPTAAAMDAVVTSQDGVAPLPTLVDASTAAFQVQPVASLSVPASVPGGALAEGRAALAAVQVPDVRAQSVQVLGVAGVVGAGALLVGGTLLFLGQYTWMLGSMGYAGQGGTVVGGSGMLMGVAGAALLVVAAASACVGLLSMVAGPASAAFSSTRN